jgi:hypothetical protein
MARDQLRKRHTTAIVRSENIDHVFAVVLWVADEALSDGIDDEIEAFERDLADEDGAIIGDFGNFADRILILRGPAQGIQSLAFKLLADQAGFFRLDACCTPRYARNRCSSCQTFLAAIMGKESRYIQGYAVVRVDHNLPLDPPLQLSLAGEDPITTSGPSNMTVKQVVMSAEEARQEVDRLNKLNADKNCAYYWQSTHIFLEGGSHGSKTGSKS